MKHLHSIYIAVTILLFSACSYNSRHLSRTHNGVPSDSIEFFIECYTPVTEYKNLSFCSSGVTTLPNIVMRFAHHAVNAYRVSIINGLSVIYYEDHSSTSLGSSFILGTEMSQIFPFDNN